MYKQYLQLSAFLGGVLLLLVGCAYPKNSPYSSKNISQQPLKYQFTDGGSAQYFYLHKHLIPSANTSINTMPVNYLFVIGGSDCTSFSYFLPQYFRGLEGESGEFHIFILQKRFIEKNTWGRNFGCSKAFVNADVPSQWLADQAEFMQNTLMNLKGSEGIKRVVILGVSEGAEIAPLVAKQIPQTTHLVLLSNGAMAPLNAFKIQREKNGAGLPEALKQLMSGVQQKPKSEGRVLGRSASYWRQISHIYTIENLLSLSVPIFMVMGERDEVVPVESARYAKEQFELANKNNLSVVIYPSANHALQAGGVNFLPDFFHKLDIWLADVSKLDLLP